MLALNSPRRRHYLVEGFGFANQAQVASRSFFCRLTAVLQIDDFRLKGGIAFLETVVLSSLFSDRDTQIPGLAIAITGKPQLPLHRKSRDGQHNND